MLPLWYYVESGKIGYKEFLDRYNDFIADEDYTAPLFALLCLKKVNPYVDEIHIVRNLPRSNLYYTVRDVVYTYLYWSLTNELINQPIIEGTIFLMSSFYYKLPFDFSTSLKPVVNAIVLKFFGVDLDQIKVNPLSLSDILSQVEVIEANNFSYEFKTITELKTLKYLSIVLDSVRNWFLHRKIPWWWNQVNQITLGFNNPPHLLKGIQIDLNQIISDLSLTTDYEYLEYMVNGLSAIYPDRLNDLQKLVTFNSKVDSGRFIRFLESIDPVERINYLPVDGPVLDSQLLAWYQEVQENGLESLLTRLIQIRKKQLVSKYPSIANDRTIVQMENIFSFPPESLVWLEYNQTIHVLAKEDIQGQNMNPFNRQSLPAWTSNISGTSQTYYQIWSNLLHRRVNPPENL